MKEIFIILMFILVFTIISLLFALFIMFSWNKAIVPIFELNKTITFFQSWLISLMWAFFINALKGGIVKADVTLKG